MKVTREQAAANREKIVEVASILFRKHGFEGIGVADIMKAAGLTHGGFYGHFNSKDDLAAEACTRALSREWWKGAISSSATGGLGRLSMHTSRRDIVVTQGAAALSLRLARISAVSHEPSAVPLRKAWNP